MGGKINVRTIGAGVYRHNKTGNLYEVIDCALDADSGKWLVIYKPLYKHPDGYKLFLRDIDIFTEKVKLGDDVKLRFEKVATD